MYDSKALAAMERSMREEHQKDLDALERLKRFLPKNGSATIEAEHVDDNNALLDLPEGPFPQTIIGKVESIMTSDVARRWTVPSMVVELKRINFPLVAKKPEATMGLVFAKLHRRGVIRIVRRGSGRTPNVFRGVQSQSQEGDSEATSKNERPTNRQAVAVH